jgi:hypothetical protein
MLSAIIVLGALCIVSCDKVENVPNESDTQGILRPGKQLENPYSVKNMRKAYANLMEKQENQRITYEAQIMQDSTLIQATDYYVRFLIENDEQRNLLLADSLNLSIVPLDVEIDQEEDYYVDENTDTEQAQWFYTSVAKDYQFHPEITYEKIEDLFLFEESELDERLGTNGISIDFLYDLEDEALLITDNYEEEEETQNRFGSGRRRVKPKGHIKVYNTNSGNFDPVVGVKVKTRRWFKWAKGWTNSQGYYKVNKSYRRNVRYTVVFKNTRGFKVWPSTISISSARYRAGKRSKYGHNINFNTNSVGWSWSTVNNAAVKYLDYCTQFGIGKPHSNLRIVANRKSGGGAAPMLRRTWGWIGFRTNSDLISFLGKMTISIPINAVHLVLRLALPDVIIKANSSQGTKRVFSLTFHELAHASHFKKVGSGYWTKYINYIITYGKINGSPYGDGSGYNSGICGVGEMWGNYLSAFFTKTEFGGTLTYWVNYDEYGGEDWYNPGFLKLVDDISDISIADIFSCLSSDTDTFDKLIAKLKTKTIHDEQVDDAYSYYTDWP